MAGMDYTNASDQQSALDQVADVAERIPQIQNWLDKSKKAREKQSKRARDRERNRARGRERERENERAQE